jgi:GxxExxY protein
MSGKKSMEINDLTYSINAAVFEVNRELGPGFLEKVYENALLVELREMGLNVRQQHPITVYYGFDVIGEYFADLLVQDCVIVELKTAEQLRSEHIAQLTNYLKATNLEVGLLLNFGNNPEFKRIVFSNRKKDPRKSAASA